MYSLKLLNYKQLTLKKITKVAGVDEVGRGCLAGPVFSAAVILNKNISIKNIKDSKKIPFKKRLLISDYIKKNSIYAVGMASVDEINKINILNASLLSMQRALDKLKFKPIKLVCLVILRTYVFEKQFFVVAKIISKTCLNHVCSSFRESNNILGWLETLRKKMCF